MSELKFITESTEIKRNQNWIKVHKLILNSTLCFNPTMLATAGKA